MPTKHVDDETWNMVEKKTMKAIFKLKKPIKETEMLKWLILKGLSEIKDDDFKRYDKNNKPD